jgi:hypothetical protein
MKPAICTICHNEVDKKKQDYYKVDLIIKGKKVTTDYAHKVCHQKKGMAQQQMSEQLMNTFKGLKNFATKQGILPEEQFIVK